MKDAIPGLTLNETKSAVDAGYAALTAFNNRARAKSRENS
jgi:phage terminase small subunit